jgi:hypothetical protein
MNVPKALNTDYNFSYRRNFVLLLGKQSGKINGIVTWQMRKQQKLLEPLQCEWISTVSYAVKLVSGKKLKFKGSY